MGAPVNQRVNVFAREGEYWTVVFDGRISRIRDAKGLHYLAHLLRHPGEEFHALALVAVVEGSPVDRDGARGLAGDAGPVLDAPAIDAYRRRYRELQEELADAEEADDADRLGRAQDELDALSAQLAAGLGLGGRHRRAGSAAERARLAVTKAIRASLRKLVEADPALGRHLDRTVRTGTFCAYLPDPSVDMVWEHEAAERPAPAAAPASRARAAPRRSPGLPFVGRPLERGVVTELVAAAAAGRGGLLLVSGEAGIGKTRLAEEAMDDARARGMETFVGRCRQGETTLAWLPLVEVLEQLVDGLADAALTELLGGTGPEVARVLPALRRRLPGLPPPVDLPAEQARQFLFTAVRDLLLRLGAARPAVVVLDDVHWADPATLSMLEHLADGLEDARILVVATYRQDEAGLGTPLARTLERLVRHPACATLTLHSLDVAAVTELVGALSGRVPPAALAARLWADADGNPFFVQELVKHLGAEGRLYDAGGALRADADAGSAGLPDSLRLLLGHRLQRLSEPCRRVLALAAVAARDVDPGLLAEATGDEGLALAAVDEALPAGVLIERGGRLAFSHALLREAVLDGVPAWRRRRLHLQVAEALRGRHGEDPEHAAEVADHLVAAADAADAGTTVRFLALAGHRSNEAAAYEDAAGRFERALGLVPASDPVTRARLLSGLAYAVRGTGRFDEAAAHWTAALDLLDASGQVDVTLAAEVSRALGRYLDAVGGLDRAIAAIRRGLRMVGDAPSPERSWLESALGYVLALHGDRREAADRIAEAAAIAEARGDDRLRADVLASRTCLDFVSGDLAACITTAEAAQEALLACGQPWDAVQAQVTTLWPRLWLGRVDSARRQAHAVLGEADRIGHRAASFLARRSEALFDVLGGGDLEAFAAHAAADVEFCRDHHLRWLADAHVFAGLAGFWRGDWERAGHHLRAASTTPAPPAYAGRYVATLLTFLAWTGDAGEFDRALAGAHASFARLGFERTLGTIAVTLAEVEGQALLGRTGEVAALAPAVADLLGAGIVLRPPDLRVVPALAGLAAAAAGDAGAAEAHFAAARRLVDDLPHPRQAPDVDFLHGVALRTAGDGRAGALVARAVTGYEALGMVAHAARARAWTA